MSLFKLETSKSFGGSKLAGKRKSCRPISTKYAMHLVLNSKQVLKNGSFLRHRKLIEATVGRATKKFDVKVYRLAVARDHIHMVIKVGSRTAYAFFVQFVSGLLALKLKIERGAKFWSYRPFTRIVEWGRDFKRTCDYVMMNELEAMRWIGYQPRGQGSSRRRRPLDEILFADLRPSKSILF
jgi:REP element-mobilizing transposase RayT